VARTPSARLVVLDDGAHRLARPDRGGGHPFRGV